MRIDFKSDGAEIARGNFTSPGYFNEMDFRESYSHLFTLKKRIRKFITSGEINERELLNDVIIITNSFKIDFVIGFASERFEKEGVEVLKSLLLFLGIITEEAIDSSSNKIVDDVLSDLRTRYNLPKAYHRP